MSHFLAIDLGDKNIGLATSDGQFAEPLATLRVKSPQEALSKVAAQALAQNSKLVVVGVSEGTSQKKAEEFGRLLSGMLQLPVEFVDETLTSLEAGKLQRDKSRQHAVSAALILQRFLDANVK